MAIYSTVNHNKIYLFILIVIFLSSCEIDSYKKNTIYYRISGIAINKVTTDQEDCNSTRIFIQLEIDNKTSQTIETMIKNGDDPCKQMSSESDMILHCKNGNDYMLKIVSDNSTILPNSKFKLKGYLIDYEYEGSLLQIGEKLDAILKNGFVIYSSKIVKNRMCIFKINNEFKKEYYLNSKRINNNDLKNLNIGEVEHVKFEKRSKIKFTEPK